MKTIRTLTLILVVGLMGAQPALAQSPASEGGEITGPDFLEATVTGHERATEQTRADLVDLLQSDQVRQIADERGVDLEEAVAAASALSDQELSAAAPLVEAATAAVQRRHTVTISLSALVIILLLILLL